MAAKTPKNIYIETRYTGATDKGGAAISIHSLRGGREWARYAYDDAAPSAHIAAVEKYIEPYCAESIEPIGYSKAGSFWRVVIGGIT